MYDIMSMQVAEPVRNTGELMIVDQTKEGRRHSQLIGALTMRMRSDTLRLSKYFRAVPLGIHGETRLAR